MFNLYLTDAELKKIEALKDRKDLLKLRDQLRELRELDDIFSKAELRFRELKEIIPNLKAEIIQTEAILRSAKVKIKEINEKFAKDALDEVKLTEAIKKERGAESRLRELQARLDRAMNELKTLSEVLSVEMPSENELTPKLYAISTL